MLLITGPSTTRARVSCVLSSWPALRKCFALLLAPVFQQTAEQVLAARFFFNIFRLFLPLCTCIKVLESAYQFRWDLASFL